MIGGNWFAGNGDHEKTLYLPEVAPIQGADRNGEQRAYEQGVLSKLPLIGLPANFPGGDRLPSNNGIIVYA